MSAKSNRALASGFFGAVALAILGVASIGAHLNQTTVIATLNIPERSLVITGELGNRISDPYYIRAYANGRMFFQCRGAETVQFTYSDRLLVLQSDCNYESAYDRMKEPRIDGIEVRYEPP